tara:strand:- start:148 stop:720 length:573 start_codon:yes stop_codon:yes gene_type:complete
MIYRNDIFKSSIVSGKIITYENGYYTKTWIVDTEHIERGYSKSIEWLEDVTKKIELVQPGTIRKYGYVYDPNIQQKVGVYYAMNEIKGTPANLLPFVDVQGYFKKLIEKIVPLINERLKINAAAQDWHLANIMVENEGANITGIKTVDFERILEPFHIGGVISEINKWSLNNISIDKDLLKLLEKIDDSK